MDGLGKMAGFLLHAGEVAGQEELLIVAPTRTQSGLGMRDIYAGEFGK